MAVAEVCLAFMRHAERRYTPAKLSAIRNALRIVRELYCSEPAQSFGPRRLAVCRDRMIDKGLSRGYVNEALQ